MPLEAEEIRRCEVCQRSTQFVRWRVGIAQIARAWLIFVVAPSSVWTAWYLNDASDPPWFITAGAALCILGFFVWLVQTAIHERDDYLRCSSCGSPLGTPRPSAPGAGR